MTTPFTKEFINTAMHRALKIIDETMGQLKQKNIGNPADPHRVNNMKQFVVDVAGGLCDGLEDETNFDPVAYIVRRMRSVLNPQKYDEKTIAEDGIAIEAFIQELGIHPQVMQTFHAAVQKKVAKGGISL